MNNNVVLIGRINNDIEKVEMDDKTIYKLMIDISRNFKNQMEHPNIVIKMT